ncbi:ABC transporter ATP-binding protein [Virgibacillus chiguensis]|uniref:Iron(III) transport system ATP-binding protein n=1 Tax=Virgibacillus chiguensis TaxID=411959 RepID=A0A1M5WLX2_9BACI|nr:ABC transporter ATP-binding protein [Virgibacillus chiguensis]SHH88600.1 iron(III) transport system ATP-binding protein [Virgibacillus chiguensis]
MIELQGIEITYDDFIAMNELNITINEGEFFTLLGPSGCGKTSLLRTITGFVSPSKGRIIIDGKDVTDESVEKRGVGIVFQSYAIFPTMNVFENIAFGLRVKRLSKKAIKEKVLEIAQMVDLSEEHLQRNASELSGGQQQRVAIARALVLQPKILCLDEPLSNLDAKLRNQLRVELKRLQKQFGITTVYVTHDQEEALTMSDKIAVFNNGKLEQLGTPNDVFNNPTSDFVATFIGDSNVFETKELATFLNAKNLSRPSGKSYLRLNHVHTKPIKEAIELEGVVTNVEYFGLYSKYTFKTVSGLTLRNVEVDLSNQMNIGDNVTLYLKQRDFIHL